MDSYNKIFMILRETDLLNYDEKHELQLYLMNLEQQVKEQKEVIDMFLNKVEKNKMLLNNPDLLDLYLKIKEVLE